MKINNIHDTFIKKIFSEKENAIDFFQNFIQKDIVKTLDLSKIKRLPVTFVGEKLKNYHSDILFELPMKSDIRDKFFIHALFEHKSYPDMNIHKQ